MSIAKFVPALALLLTLGACESGGTKPTANSGNALTAVGLGTLAGTLVGASVDAGLAPADRAALQAAELRAYAAPIGNATTWTNPQSGSFGTVTPTRDGYSSAGTYCREILQSATVGGVQKRGYGTACRQSDGSWKIVSE